MQMLIFRPHLTLVVVFGLMLPFATAQIGPNSTPVRYQAQYSQIYFDDIETVAPTLTPGFVLNPSGSLTTNPAEVISGKRSIKGVGTGSYSNFLNTNSQIIPFASKGSYRVTFHYRVVATLDQGFQAVFWSQAASQYPSNPAAVINGAAAQAGQTGTATINGTLGPYSDYQVYWAVFANGAVVVDDIQIADTASGKLVAAEDAEGSSATVGPGLQLQNGASVVTDSALVIGGKASVRLANWGSLITRPEAWALVGNTTYLVELDYRILNPGTGDGVLSFGLQPTGTADPLLGQFFGAAMLKNAPASGTYSAGALTGKAASYVLTIGVLSATTSVIVDNIRILKQSVTSTTAGPDTWSKLANLRFPRLGNYFIGTADDNVATGSDEGVPLAYSVNQLEGRLAFSDVIFGMVLDAQVKNPASIRRLRDLNPDAVILPYRISQQEGYWKAPHASNPDVEWDFHQGLAGEWYVKDTKGNDVIELGWPDIHTMNTSDFCPVRNGQTFTSYLSNWLFTTVFPSGIWDGIYLDNLFDRTDPLIPNYNDAALLDFDWNRNGLRDETPAGSSEMIRNSAIRFISDLRSKMGGSQLVIANTFHLPALVFAPYVNGYVFEQFNRNYNGYFLNTGGESTGRWFAVYDAYRRTQAVTPPPKLNVLEGSGGITGKSTGYLAPTARDFQEHRLGLGTALLDDGFYEYDLDDNLSAPYWFDEYSVDQNGVVVEDRSKKGYLGQALGDAVEL